MFFADVLAVSIVLLVGQYYSDRLETGKEALAGIAFVPIITDIILPGENYIKKTVKWTFWTALSVCTIDWLIVSVNVLRGNHQIIKGAYIALVCIVIMGACALINTFKNRCLNCGKILLSNGKYCPYCGKEQ